MDNFTPQDPMQPPIDAPVAQTGASKSGFLATRNGRIVLIGGGAVAALAVVGVVVALVFTFLLGDDPGSGSVTGGSAGSATATGTAGSGEGDLVPIEPGDVSLSEVFTFRDVFQPLLDPSEETSPDGSEPTSDTPEAAADTLFLQDIVVTDGVTTAVLIWNGTSHSLAEGGVIPGTPWQVLAIHGDTVTMLYGDAQVTLTVGQGISK